MTNHACSDRMADFGSEDIVPSDAYWEHHRRDDTEPCLLSKARKAYRQHRGYLGGNLSPAAWLKQYKPRRYERIVSLNP